MDLEDDAMAQLWGGRFTKETDQLVYNFRGGKECDCQGADRDTGRREEREAGDYGGI